MTNTQFFPIAASWILTYAVHSTLFLFGAWLMIDRISVRSMVAKDTIWKVALVGGLLTSTAQVVVGFEPFIGRYEVATSSTTPIASSVVTTAEAGMPARSRSSGSSAKA